MKVYLHYESAEPNFTYLLQVEGPGQTVQQAVDTFVTHYNAKHGPVHKLHRSNLEVWTEKKKRVSLTAAISQAFGDRDDAYLVPPGPSSTRSSSGGAPQAEAPKPTVRSGQTVGACAAFAQLNLSSTAESATQEQQQQQQQQHASTTPATARAPVPEQRAGSAAPSASAADVPAVLQAVLKNAEEAVQARNLRAARAIYEQVLQVLPGHTVTLDKLARLLMVAGKPQHALVHARQAAQQQPGSSAALQLVGEALSALGQGEEAIARLEAALVVSRAAREPSIRQRELQLALSKALHTAYEAATEAAGSDDDTSSDEEEDEGKLMGQGRAAATRTNRPGSTAAAAARAMARQLHQRCVQVVADLVAQDDTYWEHLYMYATLALEQGMLADAVRVALRLLTVRTADPGVRALLARCLALPQGVQMLLDELAGGGGDTGAALAFLANCVKEPGAVRAAVALLGRAVAVEPRNGSYALNYIHALELEQAFDAVVQHAAQFCECCNLPLAPPLQSLQGIGKATGALQPLGELTSLMWLTQAQAAAWQQPRIEPVVTGLNSGGDAGNGSSAIYAAVVCNSDSALHQRGGALESGSAGNGAERSKVMYTPEQLDLLGILFTLVKVLYVGGAVAAASHLCALVDPARCASAVELHTTLIRNEAAYFGCVLRLLRDCPPPAWPPQPPGEPTATPATPLPAPLYVCGDSHSLAPAWRQVTLRGQSRLLHPLLVTGCKIWHLRPEGRFYPKVQFYNTVRKLPRGSQVVMLFGEIDCREGLLLAVERCKYESLEEGISHTLNIYVDLLLSLIREQDFELFVHPIAPVLNETRPIVMAFAREMKRKVLATAGTPAARGRLHYLDFFDQLLLPGVSGAQPSLQPHLQFDGTHMHPAYVEYLAAALAEVP